ncbi:hypothetical protein A3F28_02330 [Candidatus Uhrbacteria bacterium RIFCSPHIGHO2_12_FULL_57_11]|uniref:Glutamyl-tRNA amidotransferase n=2 Tax=Candidatus Uhriibacteriota TaxID=1752732 RepID=A0A1F7UNK9_9BACT|nr:MAG: hypothetical protein A3D72_00165 [Candidatus Uhrbacteria bacterium RIFCSPHIGHO2_02_FULL_57_19]OGL79825.1 MAG: hypothetical protein A3F28_02330 [Candidatus Uhrbacteria bacterium RIFCSPHIGHO2_12_FULL_57_11]
MTLTEKITGDAEQALKSRDAFALGALRMIRAAFKNAEIEARQSLTDEQAQAIIASEVKKLRDSLEQFRAGGRADLAEKAEREIALLSAYLPAQMTEEEVRTAVVSKVAELGAGPSDAGQVTGALMKDLRGKADGGLVSKLVKEALG